MNSDVPNIQKSVPPHLAYACVWFTSHLGYANEEDIRELLIRFLKTKLLYWFEALSLMGEFDTAISSLKKIDKWYSVSLGGSRHCTPFLPTNCSMSRRTVRKMMTSRNWF
jgi:hypothetical protein